MKKLLILLIIFISCEKPELYPDGLISEITLEDVIELWKQDAIEFGFNKSIDHVNWGFVDFKEGSTVNGYHTGNDIVINSRKWVGNKRNINTVYHELGHEFGLKHGSTKIMEKWGNETTYLKNKREYFKLMINGRK